jgi:NAD(P) transhydrogenase subunit alpha
MRIAVPREAAAGEGRVALVPETVGRLVTDGFEVVVERGAGAAGGYPDEGYAEAGATLREAGGLLEGVDTIVRVARPTPDEVSAMAPGTTLIGFLSPLTDAEGIQRLERQGVVAFAMESVPRISRAQSMDALSSQANVAGYKAVLIAADRVPRLFPMLMTAAGTIAPARVLIMGAGVAGLQAIATARRLGAVVSAFDVRPAVKEQVESLGARFLELGVQGEETEGGYAKELTPEQQAAQQAALEERLPDFDVVITTALIPGRPAPKLIPASAVANMRPGSCIVDLAAEAGGNCELTQPGIETVREGVTIVGFTNLPSMMSFHASQLYSRNVLSLLQHLAPGGELALDFEDEITAGACVAGKPEVAAAPETPAAPDPALDAPDASEEGSA